MAKKAQHVFPRTAGWSVFSAGASRASATFPTQKEAIAIAKKKARTMGVKLYIHGRGGRIRAINSFENGAPHQKAG